jgi:hypothetical protein
LGPGANVIKLLFFVADALVLISWSVCTWQAFQLSLILASKTIMSLPLCSTVSCFTRKCKTWTKRLIQGQAFEFIIVLAQHYNKFVAFHCLSLLLSMISKVFDKISVLFELFQVWEILYFAMAKDEKSISKLPTPECQRRRRKFYNFVTRLKKGYQGPMR